MRGRRRALLVWPRILFPDGSSNLLDKMPASDPAGYAGLEGKVDAHGLQLFKGVALSTLLGVGTELGSAQQNAARAGDELVTRHLGIQPTLIVRPGWPVRAIIHQDLILKPWKG